MAQGGNHKGSPRLGKPAPESLEALRRRTQRLKLIALDPRSSIDSGVLRLNLYEPRHIAMRRGDRGYDHGPAATPDPKTGDNEDVVLVGLLATDTWAQVCVPDVPLLRRPGSSRRLVSVEMLRSEGEGVGR